MNSGSGLSELGSREREKEKGTKKTNSGSGSSELGGRERKKKERGVKSGGM